MLRLGCSVSPLISGMCTYVGTAVNIIMSEGLHAVARGEIKQCLMVLIPLHSYSSDCSFQEPEFCYQFGIFK